MKHIVNYQKFNEGQFVRMVPKPKLSEEFLNKCNMILDEININPTLHNDLIHLAKKVTHTGPEEGGNQKMGAFADRLMAEFPGINAWEDEYINTGISIPFYGKSKIGFNNSGTNGRFYTIAGYVVDKLQKKYNKYN
jgi:hypothetical protein